MDKVSPIAIIVASMITTVSGTASENAPRLPSSNYNVEIRPDNYYYHEQQLNAWFIQCYQRKQPAERYWHCNATDSETIRRFRTTLKDPAQAFTEQEDQQRFVKADSRSENSKPLIPANISQKNITAAQQRPYSPASEHKKNELTRKTDETQKSQTPIAQTTEKQTIKNEPIQRQETQHRWIIQNTDFDNPALEPETNYLLQLAAFQNKQDASRWQQRYPDIKTRVIKTQGKFTQWFNIVTARPVEYIEAIALSETIKDQTGETPWIREKKELL